MYRLLLPPEQANINMSQKKIHATDTDIAICQYNVSGCKCLNQQKTPDVRTRVWLLGMHLSLGRMVCSLPRTALFRRIRWVPADCELNYQRQLNLMQHFSCLCPRDGDWKGGRGRGRGEFTIHYLASYFSATPSASNGILSPAIVSQVCNRRSVRETHEIANYSNNINTV